MKKALFFFITLLLVVDLSAQDKSSLYGKWKMNYNGSEKDFILQKPETEDQFERNWGHFIEFHEDGTYTEKASAPCGLDDNRFSYSGKWTYNSITKVIELKDIKVDHKRPDIYNNYKVLESGTIQLISSDKNIISIKISKPWEKISEK